MTACSFYRQAGDEHLHPAAGGQPAPGLPEPPRAARLLSERGPSSLPAPPPAAAGCTCASSRIVLIYRKTLSTRMPAPQFPNMASKNISSTPTDPWWHVCCRRPATRQHPRPAHQILLPSSQALARAFVSCTCTPTQDAFCGENTHQRHSISRRTQLKCAKSTG